MLGFIMVTRFAVIFRNCGAYMRVTTAGGLPHLVNLELRQLDDTRVHPENYRLAVRTRIGGMMYLLCSAIQGAMQRA